jgi:hypothetical protein
LVTYNHGNGGVFIIPDENSSSLTVMTPLPAPAVVQQHPANNIARLFQQTTFQLHQHPANNIARLFQQTTLQLHQHLATNIVHLEHVLTIAATTFFS